MEQLKFNIMNAKNNRYTCDFKKVKGKWFDRIFDRYLIIGTVGIGRSYGGKDPKILVKNHSK